jgi:transposase InsO family protein
LTLQAIDVAIQQRRVTTAVLAHSDQGSQYTAAAYQQRLSRVTQISPIMVIENSPPWLRRR